MCVGHISDTFTPNDVLLSNTYLRMAVTQRAQGTYAQPEFAEDWKQCQSHSHAVHSDAIN